MEWIQLGRKEYEGKAREELTRDAVAVEGLAGQWIGIDER